MTSARLRATAVLLATLLPRSAGAVPVTVQRAAKLPPADVPDPRREVPDPANRPRDASPVVDRPGDMRDPRDVGDPGNDPRRFGADPFERPDPDRRGRHQFGGGGGGMAWATTDEEPTLRAELSYHYEFAPLWRATAEGAYVALGENGTVSAMDGFGFAVGLLRELRVGRRWYPHARAAIVVEGLTGRNSRSRLLGLRVGPGLEWALVDHASLAIELEATTAFLDTDAPGTEAQRRLALGLGAAARLLIDL